MIHYGVKPVRSDSDTECIAQRNPGGRRQSITVAGFLRACLEMGSARILRATLRILRKGFSTSERNARPEKSFLRQPLIILERKLEI